MYGFLERQIYRVVFSSIGFILVKYYDFDYEDLVRFFDLYNRETGHIVEVDPNVVHTFEEWKKSIQNPNYRKDS